MSEFSTHTWTHATTHTLTRINIEAGFGEPHLWLHGSFPNPLDQFFGIISIIIIIIIILYIYDDDDVRELSFYYESKKKKKKALLSWEPWQTRGSFILAEARTGSGTKDHGRRWKEAA